MNCNSCGTDLPRSAAYCPVCGAATLYAISGSTVSPDDPTAESDRPRASEYQPTRDYSSSPPFEGAQQNPYETLPPYPSLQAPPPSPHLRLSMRRIALLVGVLILLIIGSGGIYYTTVSRVNQLPIQATATAQVQRTATMQVQQATATALSNTPQGMYNSITSTSPVLDDPLTRNDDNTWDESHTSTYSCTFTGGSYDASLRLPGNLTECVAYASNFDNFALQVQMMILNGDSGGLLFRFGSTQFNGYSFAVSQGGTYTLALWQGNTTRSLASGPSSAIKTGLDQVNLIAVVASGDHIYLYVNKQFVASASDNTFHSGQIGVQATENSLPTEVAFQHVQVWHL